MTQKLIKYVTYYILFLCFTEPTNFGNYFNTLENPISQIFSGKFENDSYFSLLKNMRLFFFSSYLNESKH
jgi:hypothetical protein